MDPYSVFPYTGNTDSVANDGKVTGPLLKKLIVDKWEYMHQVSINRIREGIPLVNAKYFFCLEIDWHYVNQLGFEMVRILLTPTFFRLPYLYLVHKLSLYPLEWF